MKELLKVEVNENQEPIISGRMLHEFLEISTPYKKWFDRMVEYGFTENIDFVTVGQKCEIANGGYQNKIDHAIKLDMAKELSMIQRNEKGKQARQYFIGIEKEWNSPEKVMARALVLTNKKIESQNLVINEQSRQIEADKPKAIFADAVTTSKQSILIGELAKILKQNGINTGEKRLFEWLRTNKYLISRKGTDYNMPTQKSMDLGLFEIKETAITHSDGHVTVNKTTKVTGKGQIYFVNKFKSA